MTATAKNEIVGAQEAFAKNANAMKLVGLEAWKGLQAVNGHFERIGVGTLFKAVTGELGVLENDSSVLVELTEVGNRYFEGRKHDIE